MPRKKPTKSKEPELTDYFQIVFKKTIPKDFEKFQFNSLKNFKKISKCEIKSTSVLS